MLKLLICALPALWISTSSIPPQEAASQSPSIEKPALSIERPAPSIERPGVFVPASSESVALDLEAYRGELKLKEVVEHGTMVQVGDVLARLDLEAIELALHDAEMEIGTTSMRHQHLVRQSQMDEDGARRKLDQARRDLERGRRAYDGWLKFEKEFAQREQERSAKYQQNNIEDQREELTQLESMYREDELTDATEEIVLNRTRRDFAMAVDNMKLSDERRTYQKSYVEPVEHERRKEQFEEQERGMERLLASQEMEREQRQDALKKSEEGLAKVQRNLDHLRADKERLTVRARRSGILLHGALEDYGPGRVPPRHQAGRSVNAGADLFTIAEPDRFKIALDLPESMIGRLTQGQAVSVCAVVGGKSLVGPLRFDRFPAPRSMASPENLYEAWVTLDAPLIGIVAGMRAKVCWDSPAPASAAGQ